MTEPVFSSGEEEEPLHFPLEEERRGHPSQGETPPEATETAEGDLGSQNAWETTTTGDRSDSLENPSEPTPDPEASQEEFPASGGLGNGWGGWRGVAAGLVMGIAATLAGIYALSQSSSRPSPEAKVMTETVETQAVEAPSVTVAPVEVATVLRTLDGTGTVAAHDLLPVLPQANGLQIKQVVVQEGDTVAKGQVMAVLDDSVLRSQIAEEIAKVESADAASRQAEVQVMQAQSGQKEAAAGIDQAQAQVVQAKADALQAASGIETAKASVAQAQAGVAQARAKLEQAEREVARSQELANQGVISQQDLEKRRTEAKTAQEDVNKAIEELNKSIEEVRVAQAKLINAQANIKTAEATVNSAQAKFDTSVSNIYSAKANVGNSQANIRSNVARVQQLRTQLEQTLVRAPESGIVAERIARVGDVSNGSQKLFSLIRGGKLELQVKVPETQLPQIRIGAPVRVTSDVDARIALRGMVREIAPNVDPQNRQATVKIDLPPIAEIRESPLRPGMFLRAAIGTATGQGLKIPAKALLPQADGKAVVYRLLGENKVQAQTVEIGEISGGSGKDLSQAKVEIKNGLNPGDRVVVTGAGYLKDGDRVKVVPENGVVPNAQL